MRQPEITVVEAQPDLRHTEIRKTRIRIVKRLLNAGVPVITDDQYETQSIQQWLRVESGELTFTWTGTPVKNRVGRLLTINWYKELSGHSTQEESRQ